MKQRLVDLSGVTHFVLDEADRMLDMGFIHDVRRIAAAVPKKRQTLLFSATMPPAIAELARGLLDDPVRVAITPAVTTAERVEQSVDVRRESGQARSARAISSRDQTVARAIVFTRTKHGANRLSEQLGSRGHRSASDSRQQIAERTRARARRVPSRHHARSRRDRRRRARHRRRRHLARHQLRLAERRRELRSPHRPHGPRGSSGLRDLVLRSKPSAVSSRTSSG